MATGDQPPTGEIDTSSNRLICSGEEGEIGSGGGDDAGENFKPNVMVYGGFADNEGNLWQTTWGPASPRTNDFAIEAWIKRNYPDSITNWDSAAASAQGYGFTGWHVPSSAIQGGAGGFWFRGTNFEAVYATDNSWSGQVGITAVLPFGWCHVAVNFDRSDNMTLYVNGVSMGTAAITTEDMQWSSPGMILCDVTNAQAASGKVHPPYRIAGLAFHNSTLLTVAQIQNSVDNITLQSLGTSTTVSRVMVSDTVLLPANSSVADSTFSWVTPYDPPSGVDNQGLSSGEITTVLEEISEDTYAVQESTYETAPSGTTEKGARTTYAANLYIDWYFSEYAGGNWFFDIDAVFADDPSWPPQMVDEKGYA